MKTFPAFRRNWGCYAVLLISAILIKPAQDFVESRSGQKGPDQDLLFFSSPELAKKMALGYDAIIADLYWMRTIQYYGRREEASKRPVRYKNLATLLDITTTLDPYILDVYRAGSSFLSEPDPIGAGQPKEAIKLLEKGIRSNPQEWRLFFDKGFVYYIYLRDFKTAGEVWLAASRLSNAPNWMESLAAVTLSKGGALDVAAYLWQRQYEESSRADVKENARNNLIAIQATKDLRMIRMLVEKFRAETGSFPGSLRQLLRSQGRSFNMADPLGYPYWYDPQTGMAGINPKSQIQHIYE
jgi:tetratricopeptide (TPR) repeat protein